jgi:hypothetical protein
MESDVKDETDDTPVLQKYANDAPASALHKESSHKTYLVFNEMMLFLFCIYLSVDIFVY